MGITFAGNMNLPPPVQSYSSHLEAITAATVEVANDSKRLAAKEAEAKFGKDIGVSCDGTWQKRDFSSRNDVTTVLTNMGANEGSKVIDTEVLTTFCAKCSQANNENTTLAKVRKHKCLINREGSAGKMEGTGIMRVFKRSQELYDLRYTRYLGDGDSKSYTDVSNANIYDVDIVKEECCGHVQKRMGKALINVVTEWKGKTLVIDKDGVLVQKEKPDTSSGEKLVCEIGGAGKLTGKAIKSIQGHYGAAIRNNVGDLSGMKDSIRAIHRHRSGNHDNCPSWCRSDDKTKADKNKLPSFVRELMKPAFTRLSAETLLTKCLYGGTQNANESYHNLIWPIAQNSPFVGRLGWSWL